VNWKRPFFIKTVRFAWRVAGAHDLAPITTHDLNRFERYSVLSPKFEAHLPELFPAFLEAARRLDLAHVSLMLQPEHKLVGVVTTAPREGRQAPPSLETVRLSTDALALRGSVSEACLTELGARKIFDRPQPGRMAAVVGAGQRSGPTARPSRCQVSSTWVGHSQRPPSGQRIYRTVESNTRILAIPRDQLGLAAE
jgi:hypothetical protein